ncbi:hypothetical protein K505DRAFT_322765 [Melanomma pulvis-pyrius CBS 109.77]|uniref:Proteinase inhibitor I78 n=1 Tax=Melanomma pulvis-pyrius CBS 109.77 TaxID=1314802 RepID=A0A6A6XKY2_9PLEO|nr:hypothetical protein K505DRAFT_322765 [Melanomma pulvis-pyrius CBS 109.77]
MPLVVPGLQSNSAGASDDWQSKLVGKKLGDAHDEVTFAKQDLPASHRVIRPDSMSTMDFRPERVNIHVDGEGTVRKVVKG